MVDFLLDVVGPGAGGSLLAAPVNAGSGEVDEWLAGGGYVAIKSRWLRDTNPHPDVAFTAAEPDEADPTLVRLNFALPSEPRSWEIRAFPAVAAEELDTVCFRMDLSRFEDRSSNPGVFWVEYFKHTTNVVRGIALFGGRLYISIASYPWELRGGLLPTARLGPFSDPPSSVPVRSFAEALEFYSGDERWPPSTVLPGEGFQPLWSFLSDQDEGTAEFIDVPRDLVDHRQ